MTSTEELAKASNFVCNCKADHHDLQNCGAACMSGRGRCWACTYIRKCPR